ncbi:MAG: hypothetical protein ABUL50_04170 [Rhizobacter sp.]
MTGSLFGVIEMSIFLGIPLVWAVWELVKLRREQARDREREAAQPPGTPDRTER